MPNPICAVHHDELGQLEITAFVIEPTENMLFPEVVTESPDETIERHRCKTARLYASPSHVFIAPESDSLPTFTVTSWLRLKQHDEERVIVFMLDGIEHLSVRAVFQKAFETLTLDDLNEDGWKDADVDTEPRLRIVKT